VYQARTRIGWYDHRGETSTMTMFAEVVVASLPGKTR
jgi:hypothetical protein